MSKLRVALPLVVLCFLLGSLSSWMSAQGARMTPSGVGDATDRDDPAGRDKWFMQGRVAPAGKTPAEMRWQAYQQKIQMRAARIVAARKAGAAQSLINTAGSVGWTALGPAPLVSNPGSGQDYGFVSGRATSVTIDPADTTGNTVYLGGAYGGLWRSQNGAASSASSVTWTPLIDNQPTLAVGAIGLQPCSVPLGNCDGLNHLSKVILVGTGEANSSADSYYGLGILRSTDAGQTWTLIKQDSGGKPFLGMAVSKIAFSSTNPSLVVAAVATSSPGVIEGARTIDNRGLYVSTNGGASWTYETSVKDGTTSIAPPSNSVTSVVFNAAAGKFYAAFRYRGFYSSTDGANWTRLTNQPAAAGSGLNGAGTCPTSLVGVTSITCPIYRGEIAVVPNRNEMYAFYVDPGDGDQGIWKSLDGGATWAAINVTGITNCGDTGGCDTVQGSYDLELAAVPNGATGTDLYAGARNVYKCTITSAVPDCSGTGANFLQNLTHVYGCVGSGPAVHPDQHSLDFIVSGGAAVMYFAHDGGINRSLNGFALSNSGSCTTPFDDLNGTLGSMTEFVSFSQDATNSAILLGGTQDNGSPSTSQTNSSWHSVLGGDGGYNEIDPAIPNNWYTANTDVSIQQCTAGSSCLEGNFSPVISTSTVGNDAGPFYTNYTLDPQNTASQSGILVATCRIWRGTVSAGSPVGFTAISPDFFLAGAIPCSGTSAPIRSMAVGGPKDANGFSSVIYAGLEGTGPLPGANAAGGSVWVTLDSGNTWTQVRTGSTNQFYTIGDIAIDSSDATGKTAFVGLQGFGTVRVVKTADGGATWNDFTGVLPNAPVDSLVVDAALHIVYVGTDVGVFSSPSASASSTWTEVGPAPISGTAGYIPDAPVTRLRLFNHGGVKILRASTYGRGIWQFTLSQTPDYQVAVTTATLTTYPATSVSFAGTATAIGGYNSSVTLSCTAGAAQTPPKTNVPPSTCTPTPAAGFVPATSPATTTIGLAASDASTVDRVFNLHATDGTIVHDTQLTLQVVDFALGALSAPGVTANVPNASGPITFNVTASGSFADSVTLTCSGLPAGASCVFSPSATVNPTSATPAAVSLTVATTAGEAASGPTTVTITAHDATHAEPTAKTRTFTLNVTANPDYTLAISNPTPAAITVQGQQAFNGTLTAINAYNKPVAISCIAGATAPPATCVVTTSPTTPTAGGATFTVLAADTVANTYNFVIHTTDGTITHDTPVTLVLNEDFHIINTATSQTVTAGGTAMYTPFNFKPDGAATFLTAVTYTCTGLPSLSTCAFSPSTITAGSGNTPVTLSILTTAAIAGATPPASPWKPSGPFFAFWLAMPALGIVSLASRRQSRKRLGILGGLLALGLIGAFAGCGSTHHGSPGTPPGTYTITVNAVSGIAKQSTTVQMVVQ